MSLLDRRSRQGLSFLILGVGTDLLVRKRALGLICLVPSEYCLVGDAGEMGSHHTALVQ